MSADLNEGERVSGPTFGLADLALACYFDRIERLSFAGLWEDAFPAVGTWLSMIQTRLNDTTAVSDFIRESIAQAQRASGEVHWPELRGLWSNI
ncbi:glutathione S-transferase domain-containing protein [Octadecabacter sp. G9-8]|uniref:Glutathione S-transferase domain-containing protein n=2 Tax=Octadecabacter dasysiphoniae TaxID=2909341 RepID=A0ABS9CT87_9RHOB|nr:glutathione S-transferase domain-containing protein [Octadecabacter dasysiphoniae]